MMAVPGDVIQVAIVTAVAVASVVLWMRPRALFKPRAPKSPPAGKGGGCAGCDQSASH
jgi:hypothetical protein